MKKNILHIFCLCLHNNFINQLKKLKYIPVGLGDNFFNSKFLRDNTKNNISKKNRYYGEYTFHYWFWKNMLNKMNNNQWIGFCAYRRFWSQNDNLSSDYISSKVNKYNFQKYVLKTPSHKWNGYETILGEEIYINSKIKVSKIMKNDGIKSIINNLKSFILSKSNLKFHFDVFHGTGKIEKAILLLDKKDKYDFYEFLINKRSFNRGNMFICRSKKVIEQYYKDTFKWLKKCENIFGFKEGAYGETRIYAFLAERYLSYWFNKYSHCSTWPIFFSDTSKFK